MQPCPWLRGASGVRRAEPGIQQRVEDRGSDAADDDTDVAGLEDLGPRRTADQVDEGQGRLLGGDEVPLARHHQGGAEDAGQIDGLAAERGLTEEEIALIRDCKWIEMIHYGVSFFMLEKMAAVLGVPNPEVYAAFRGETLEEFQASRKVPINYGVGGDKSAELDTA